MYILRRFDVASAWCSILSDLIYYKVPTVFTVPWCLEYSLLTAQLQRVRKYVHIKVPKNLAVQRFCLAILGIDFALQDESIMLIHKHSIHNLYPSNYFLFLHRYDWSGSEHSANGHHFCLATATLCKSHY